MNMKVEKTVNRQNRQMHVRLDTCTCSIHRCDEISHYIMLYQCFHIGLQSNCLLQACCQMSGGALTIAFPEIIVKRLIKLLVSLRIKTSKFIRPLSTNTCLALSIPYED